MIKIVESQSLRTTWNISSWTYYIIPNLMLITVVMLSVTMASQIMFTFESLSTQMPRISGPPRRSITDIHSRFRGCGVVLNWCSRRCCRWWWWWRRGGKQWVNDVSDECQSVCEGIRVQYIPLTEIRFAIETVISKYSLFPYKYIGSQTPLFLWDFVTDNDEVGTNV